MPRVTTYLPAPILAILLLVPLALPLQGCGCSGRDEWAVEPGDAPPGFEALSGGIGVIFTDYSGEGFTEEHVLFRDGGIAWTDKLESRKDPVTGTYEKEAEPLPEIIEGYHIPLFPTYEASPDGGFAAVAATPKDQDRFGRQSVLLIVDLDPLSVVAQVELEAGWITSLAWSPDGGNVAFIRKRSETGKCGLEALLPFLGHGSVLQTYALDVVDMQADTVATSPLLDRSFRYGEVVWIK